MKRNILWTVVIFGTLWGLSEAMLGGWLYAHDVPYASVPLTVIGLGLLCVARALCDRPGTSAAIGAVAMLFKFLNLPFFACHIAAIFLLGASFDLCVSLVPRRGRVPAVAAGVYLGYLSFGLIITYVFRYSRWPEGGMMKILHYVGVGGSMAAVASAALSPLWFALGRRMREELRRMPTVTERWTAAAASLGAVAVWVLAVILHVQAATYL